MATTNQLSVENSNTKVSLPGWLIAWALLILTAAAIFGWSWLTPSQRASVGEVFVDLPSLIQDLTEDDPFLPAEDANRIPPNEKNAGKAIGTSGDYRVAVIVTNLGPDQNLLERAAKELPISVNFALRADTPNLQSTIDSLRSDGREVLLMVPMEPDGYPHNDPGPNPLLTSNTTEENLKRISAHTENAKGIIGISPFMGHAFTRSTNSIDPIASWLSKSGFALLDFTNLKQRSQLIEAVLQYGGTYIDNPVLLTEGLSDEHMKLIKLEYMETVAKREMMSIGIIEACPEAIPFLNEWFRTLPEKRIKLTPVSASYLPDVESDGETTEESETAAEIKDEATVKADADVDAPPTPAKVITPAAVQEASEATPPVPTAKDDVKSNKDTSKYKA